MNVKYDLEFLKNNPVFWSRLGFCYDPPIENERGEPLVFTENFEKYVSTHRDFLKAGVKIHTSILHSGWVGVDKYDYTLTDRVLDAVFSAGDDILYIPRIKLNVPIDWCYENPEDVFVYYGGPDTADGIRALVGTEKQDYLGYESPSGYYRAGDYVDPRPNVGGLIARQSFSSERWLCDAGEALRRLVGRLESSKYADRIIGYHIAYGISGETALWGRINKRYGDYGINNRRALYKYGLEKYGSPDALAEAWCQENVTEDTLRIPTPDERAGRTSVPEEYLRFRDTDRLAIDLDLFTAEVNANALEHFAKIVKSRADKLVGAFYGYLLYIDNSAYTGHIALERLLSSPYVDFFAAPKAYARSGAGEPGGEICPAQSINLRKLFVDELDNRTYLATENEDDKKDGFVAANSSDSVSVMWREFSKDLSHNSGFWWMDLGGGWFADELLMSTVKSLVDLNGTLRCEAHESVSDVLVVFDERSMAYMRESVDMHRGYLRELITNLAASSVVFDVYRARDLERIDLSRYKLVIFAYNVYADSSLCRLISELPESTTVAYCYLFGAWDEKGSTLSRLPDSRHSEYDFPLLSNTRSYSPTESAIAITEPYITSKELRSLAERAGCHVYTEAEDVTVYADNRFTAVFNDRTTVGTVTLRERGDYVDAVSGEIYLDTDVVPLPSGERWVRFIRPL